jgi:hypothetical protein
MVSLYTTTTYDEDERVINPTLYKVNRLCEHCIIKGTKAVKKFLDRFDMPSTLLNEQISFSVLWNLPRKDYGETKKWVCLSGETHNGFAPFKHFVISDNLVTAEAQKKATEIIEYLNRTTEEEIVTLGKAINTYGENNLYYDTDIQLSDEGIVFKNSDIAVYKYRFEKYR